MTPPRKTRARERGVALLLVLWVFMIIGVLALDFGRYMRDDASAALNDADETQGYYLAVGGMMRALWSAQQDREAGRAGVANPGTTGSNPPSIGDTGDNENPFPVDGGWHAGTLAGGHYEVRLTDQGGLVSLNKTSDVVLTRLVTALMLGTNYAVKGMDSRTADSVATVVDRILDYRDPDRLKRTHGLESAPGYVAKNAWFDAPEELLRIPGISPDLVYGTTSVEKTGLDRGTEVQLPGLKDVVSVYNRADTINIKTAPLILIGLLLGKDADGIAALKDLKDSDPAGYLARVQAEAQTVDPSLLSHFVDEAPKTVLVEGRADVTHERGRASVAAVVELSGEDADGPKIIRWFDRAPWDGVLPAIPGDEGAVS